MTYAHITASNCPEVVDTLWVFPDVKDVRDETLYLLANRSKKGALEERRRQNNFKSYSMKNTWRKLLPEPVKFSTFNPNLSDLLTVNKGNAPIMFWALVDLSNGHVYDNDGRVWVHAFEAKAAALAFAKKCRQENPNCVKFSTPYRMYQQI